MKKPLIALSARGTETGTRIYYDNESYFNYVSLGGGIPCLVKADNEEDAEQIAEDMDALLITGGEDVDPFLYDEENTFSIPIDADLDASDIYLYHAFRKAGKPVLGICRGHQILNIYFGGTLVQDIGYGGKMLHTPSVWGIDKVHPTRASAGSWIAKIYGKTDIRTNSAHHQAVKRLGAGMVPCQWGEDRIIEACYHNELPVISVQWHPERMCFEKERNDTDCGQPVFEYFLDMCQKYRNV